MRCGFCSVRFGWYDVAPSTYIGFLFTGRETIHPRLMDEFTQTSRSTSHGGWFDGPPLPGFVFFRSPPIVQAWRNLRKPLFLPLVEGEAKGERGRERERQRLGRSRHKTPCFLPSFRSMQNLGPKEALRVSTFLSPPIDSFKMSEIPKQSNWECFSPLHSATMWHQGQCLPSRNRIAILIFHGFIV